MSGRIVPLENVPDPVFSEKMMGNGLAIQPSDGVVRSPIDGKVIFIPSSKHAIGLKANNGTEILIHVGLETVALKGEGFNIQIQVGDKVTVGQQLAQVNLAYIQNQGKNPISPIIITNEEDRNKEFPFPKDSNAVAGKTIIIQYP